MNRRQFLQGMTTGGIALSMVGCGGNEIVPMANLTPAEQQAATQTWFQDARFGMFIHWGVYSLLGNGEWVMNNTEMTVEEYEKLPSRFNPVQYDPAKWVALAKQAGMKYITITSKHHDGFAMWHSRVSPYNIVDATPYGKDVLKMLSVECEKQGLGLFFYHSHLDWRHPDYYPRGRTGQHSGRPESGEFSRYLDYMDAQIAELAGGEYGKLKGFWFDGWWDHHINHDVKTDRRTTVDWRMEKTYDLIHELLPGSIIGNNHHVAPFPGEGFQMFERDLPGANSAGFNTTEIGALPLETCDTVNGSWGYNKNDDNWKTSTELIHYLVRASGFDANLLLNVGPTPEGTFQPEIEERLVAMGDWTTRYGESIYGTRGGPTVPADWGVTTRTEDRVFVHVLDPETGDQLTLPGTSSLAVKSATLFDTETAVPVQADGDVVLKLDGIARDGVDTIIELELDA